jgi:FkbM family methyltransferase
MIANRERFNRRRREISFYRSLLHGFRKGDLILDVGANDGGKTDVFLKLGAHVIAVEPDEQNQEILAERFLKYRLLPQPVVVVGKAVSDSVSVEKMWIDGPGSALNTFSVKWIETLKRHPKHHVHSAAALDFCTSKHIETTTLEQLFAAYGVPFFLKVDVEGYEVNVLRGMHHPVPYISFEVNLPEFRSEGLECIEFLARLRHGTFNYAIDCEVLMLDRWLYAEEFSKVLMNVQDESIEVFWKAPVGLV